MCIRDRLKKCTVNDVIKSNFVRSLNTAQRDELRQWVRNKGDLSLTLTTLDIADLCLALSLDLDIILRELGLSQITFSPILPELSPSPSYQPRTECVSPPLAVIATSSPCSYVAISSQGRSSSQRFPPSPLTSNVHGYSTVLPSANKEDSPGVKPTQQQQQQQMTTSSTTNQQQTTGIVLIHSFYLLPL